MNVPVITHPLPQAALTIKLNGNWRFLAGSAIAHQVIVTVNASPLMQGAVLYERPPALRTREPCGPIRNGSSRFVKLTTRFRIALTHPVRHGTSVVRYGTRVGRYDTRVVRHNVGVIRHRPSVVRYRPSAVRDGIRVVRDGDLVVRHWTSAMRHWTSVAGYRTPVDIARV